MKQASPLEEPAWTARLRRCRRPVILVAAWLLLSAMAAVELGHVQSQGRSEVEARYRLRAETTSRFVETYVSDFFQQEERAAVRVLGGKMTSRAAFNRTVTLIGAKSAVLLDAKGDVIESAPTDPKLGGADLGGGSHYLRQAVGGVPAVSNVVPSPADGTPVVDFAVPFQRSGATRIFSSSFAVGSTPLAGYIQHAAVLAPNRAYLIDASGKVFASNDPEQRSGAALPTELAAFGDMSSEGITAAHSDAGDYLVARPVPGTSWRVIVAAPRSTIYSTIGGIGRVVPWVLWLGFVAGGLLSITLFERLSRRRQRLADLNEQLELLARIDVLTGLPNRRAAEEELERGLAACNRYSDPLSILMVDIDRFKNVNDEYGHATGDAALRHVADKISATLRASDVAGRWAGDEFLLVLPHLNEEEAAALAERLNDHVSSAPLEADGAKIALGISIGVAQWSGDHASGLIDRADKALYAAKRAGRNQFSIAKDEATPFPLSGSARSV